MYQEKDYAISGAGYSKHVTVYNNPQAGTRARIFYFHGGGLLYGSRRDLPAGHIEAMTSAGYEILAFDYPLAPAAGLDEIVPDVCASISLACSPDAEFTDGSLPYFLWGRSAGAYLCLIAAAFGPLGRKPQGILSYYGYGFLCEGWFCFPSPYYRTLPPVDSSCLEHLPEGLHADGSLDTHYSVYVYARQSGTWNRLIYHGREKFFYLNYSLRTCDALPCPLFCAHSTGDPDVPYEEFVELCSRYSPQRFIASQHVHDFDRDPDSPFTPQVLEASAAFLNANLPPETAGV